MLKIDKYEALKLSCQALGFSLTELADKHGVQVQSLRKVCGGTLSSRRIERIVNEVTQLGHKELRVYLKNTEQRMGPDLLREVKDTHIDLCRNIEGWEILKSN
jgi:hypothetical protein